MTQQSQAIPDRPKIYHIVHIDRLSSIVKDGCLWCDAEILQRPLRGATIGMNTIKQRRLTELTLTTYPDLHVADCVPFYFCPRSIMLYLLYQGNHPELSYRGGQQPIIHLQADLFRTVTWAKEHGQRWAFTRSNAGAYYFEDYCDLAELNRIDWKAVQAVDWQKCKEGKQAEFLIERKFPWTLVSYIGVKSPQIHDQVSEVLENSSHKPRVRIKRDWYY